MCYHHLGIKQLSVYTHFLEIVGQTKHRTRENTKPMSRALGIPVPWLIDLECYFISVCKLERPEKTI